MIRLKAFLLYMLLGVSVSSVFGQSTHHKVIELTEDDLSRSWFDAEKTGDLPDQEEGIVL